MDSRWDYGYADAGLDAMDPSFTPTRELTPNQTEVPSCMDVVAGGAAGYLGPSGTAFYRTFFDGLAVAGTALRLQFQACSFYCRVFVNGKRSAITGRADTLYSGLMFRQTHCTRMR